MDNTGLPWYALSDSTIKEIPKYIKTPDKDKIVSTEGHSTGKRKFGGSEASDGRDIHGYVAPPVAAGDSGFIALGIIIGLVVLGVCICLAARSCAKKRRLRRRASRMITAPVSTLPRAPPPPYASTGARPRTLFNRNGPSDGHTSEGASGSQPSTRPYKSGDYRPEVPDSITLPDGSVWVEGKKRSDGGNTSEEESGNPIRINVEPDQQDVSDNRGFGTGRGEEASVYMEGFRSTTDSASENASGGCIQVPIEEDSERMKPDGQKDPQIPKDASEEDETFILPEGVERYFEEKRAQKSRLRAEDNNTVVKLGGLMTDSKEDWDRRYAVNEAEETSEEDDMSKMAVSEFGGANEQQEGAVSIEIEQLEDGEVLKRETLTKNWVDKSTY
jgi:hypothetical protein